MTRAVEIAVQVAIVFIGSAAFRMMHIGGREWGISLALGFASIPLGALIRLLPNQPFERHFILMCLLVVLTDFQRPARHHHSPMAGVAGAVCNES